VVESGWFIDPIGDPLAKSGVDGQGEDNVSFGQFFSKSSVRSLVECRGATAREGIEHARTGSRACDHKQSWVSDSDLGGAWSEGFVGDDLKSFDMGKSGLGSSGIHGAFCAFPHGLCADGSVGRNAHGGTWFRGFPHDQGFDPFLEVFAARFLCSSRQGRHGSVSEQVPIG
jgi:hypothetical protein